MPAVGRAGVDASTGHGGFSPRSAASSGSPDVFVNNKPALRVSDTWPSHSDGTSSHDDPPSTQSVGSSTVFVNGKALARIGDSISCGDALAVGSDNVICG